MRGRNLSRQSLTHGGRWQALAPDTKVRPAAIWLDGSIAREGMKLSRGGWRLGSVPAIEFGELLPVEKNDVTLVVVDEAENAEFAQMRQ